MHMYVRELTFVYIYVSVCEHVCSLLCVLEQMRISAYVRQKERVPQKLHEVRATGEMTRRSKEQDGMQHVHVCTVIQMIKVNRRRGRFLFSFLT